MNIELDVVLRRLVPLAVPTAANASAAAAAAIRTAHLAFTG
jgi:hypothetical protein